MLIQNPLDGPGFHEDGGERGPEGMEDQRRVLRTVTLVLASIAVAVLIFLALLEPAAQSKHNPTAERREQKGTIIFPPIEELEAEEAGRPLE